MRRSFEESLDRLGIDRVQLLHLHDPEAHLTFDEAMRPKGPVDALLRLQAEGLVDHLGIAGGPVNEMRRYVDSGAFEVLLTHSRYTLVDRSASALIAHASGLGLGVIKAARFGGGVLARRQRAGDRYAYGLGSAKQAQAAGRMWRASERAGVPLAAAALRFAAGAPGVDCVLVGASSPRRVDELIGLTQISVPDSLMEELEALVPLRDEWIDT